MSLILDAVLNEFNGWLLGAIGALSGAVGYLYVSSLNQAKERDRILREEIARRDQTIVDLQNKRLEDLRESNKDYLMLTERFAEFMKQVKKFNNGNG